MFSLLGNVTHDTFYFCHHRNWLAERKDKIEDGNRILVQKFRSQLTQQLEILHKTVSASVMQQEAQLKEVEEDMQLFVSTKAEVYSLMLSFSLSYYMVYLIWYGGRLCSYVFPGHQRNQRAC